MSRRRLLPAVVGVLVLALTGCVRMPTEGPVVATGGLAPDPAVGAVDYDPQPPRAGQSAEEVVLGFLEAMEATPVSSNVAREYLTAAARETWEPEQAIITYGELGEPFGELDISIPITDVNEYDASGAWTRRVGNGAADGLPDDTLDFRLAVEGEQWRISDPPDALVVPASWFDSRFRRVSLYFFDPSAQLLVPEPVYVPDGDQLAGSLLRGLLVGPPPSRPGVTRSFLPDTLEPGLSVPISRSGVAEVPFLGDVADSGQLVTEQMLAQLTWTLRQEPRIRALRPTLGGVPLTLPDGGTEVRVSSGGGFDPNGVRTSAQLFGLREGLLVSGTAGDLQPTSGPFGTERLGVREVAVDLTGTEAAGVSDGGRSLLVAPVSAQDARAEQVLTGASNLLRPAWDVSGRLWIVDREASGARVSVVVDGQAREVAVPQVTGRDVVRFLVSRDGTRFVALVRGPRRDRVLAARVVHDAQGRVLRLTRPRELDLREGQPARISDIGWRSLTSVAVLNRITGDLSQVRTVPVEGAPGDTEPPEWSRMRGGARHLASSPVEGEGVLVVSNGEYSDLTDPNRRVLPLPGGATALGYAG